MAIIWWTQFEKKNAVTFVNSSLSSISGSNTDYFKTITLLTLYKSNSQPVDSLLNCAKVYDFFFLVHLKQY